MLYNEHNGQIKGVRTMKKKNSITKRQFESLSQEQQAKELKKMAKRANVRASLLEESGIQNQAYYQAQDYNFDQGRLKNRFYEGTKYKSKEEIKEAYSALSNFLNNKRSTLGGVEEDVQQRVKTLIQKGQFDFNTLTDMSEKEKIYVAKEASRQANKQLKQLEKAHLTKFAYEVADHYNKETGRAKNRFYTGGKFKNEKNINIHIQNVAHFLNSKTATPEGYEQINAERLEAFRRKGIEIPKGKEKEFYDFLSSEQFKNLGKYADSNQIIETFVDARNAGIDAEMINREFREFMNTDMTFDEVQEKLNVAKWQQGGLLH
jgi:hypothetical protein